MADPTTRVRPSVLPAGSLGSPDAHAHVVGLRHVAAPFSADRPGRRALGLPWLTSSGVRELKGTSLSTARVADLPGIGAVRMRLHRITGLQTTTGYQTTEQINGFTGISICTTSSTGSITTCTTGKDNSIGSTLAKRDGSATVRFVPATSVAYPTEQAAALIQARGNPPRGRPD
jgi:hypothetical protein